MADFEKKILKESKKCTTFFKKSRCGVRPLETLARRNLPQLRYKVI